MFQRLIAAFHPQRLPLMTRQCYRHELVTSYTLPLAVAMMEAGVIGVIAEKIFDVGNMLLAVFSAAPMFSNLTSLLWARLARGRPKVRVINAMQIGVLGVLVAVAVLPISDAGGYLLAATYVIARCLIAGIITVRSAVWRANYPRRSRGQITARLSVVMTLCVLSASLAAALLLDADPRSFRVFYPAAALIAAVGVIAYSRVRVRRERDMLAFERRPAVRPTPHGEQGPIYEYDPQDTGGFWAVLKRDKTFRSYMTWQFMLGASNMMVEAPVIKLAADTSDQVGPLRLFGDGAMNVGFIVAIGLTQVIPVGLAMLTVGWWGKLLDRMHIAHFRARQGWLFVVSQGLTAIAAWLITQGNIGQGLGVLAAARLFLGIGRGGGMIAWNLGHNDFASRRMVAVYMGIHVTLTGVRGAVFPFLGMALYAGWADTIVPFVGWRIAGWAGLGTPAFAIAAALGTVGAVGYYMLSRKLRHADVPDETD